MMETPAYLIALRNYYKLHPVFEYITPTEAVLLEHPHIAETDPTRLAYSRSPKDGEDFLVGGHRRQTLTSVTKYLRRHYPDIKDSELFKLSQQHEEFLFLTDIKQIIHAVETGPSSCMKSSSPVCKHNFDRAEHGIMLQWLADSTREEPEWELHPYSVYSLPGWRLAIHKGPHPGTREHAIVGRALVYNKTYVRSFYQAKEPGGYSQADIALENWLDTQGCEKADGWPHRTPIALIDTDDGPLLPYIDGDCQEVDVRTDRCYIVEDGEYKADNTDGTGTPVEDEEEDEEEDEPIACCDCCGGSIYDYDECNQWGDSKTVCDCCLTEFTHAKAWYGGHVVQWYVKDDAAIWVDGDAWDGEYLPDCFVQLEDGLYANIDNAVCIDDEYYLHTDDRVIQIDDRYFLQEDCWQDVDNVWHHDDEEYVVFDGKKYSKDDLRVCKTVEGLWCLTVDTWEDGEGKFHHNDVDSHELDGKLWTTEQRDWFTNLYQIPLNLEIA